MANESEFSTNDTNSREHEYLMPFEVYETHHHGGAIAIGSIIMTLIIVGIVANTLGLASLIHFRMWLKHEGYVYLVAIFAANIGILIFDSTTNCILHLRFLHYPPDSSNFMCKFWHFFMVICFAPGWLSVALLFNVYLREHLTQRRRCGCPIFAAKYCTLFASKIIVGIIFGVVLILGLPDFAIYRLHEGSFRSYCSDQENIRLASCMYMLRFCIMWILPFAFFLPVILLLTLCMSRDGEQFGFSSIEERSLGAEQFRTVAVTLSSTNLFSYFLIELSRVTIYVNGVFEFTLETALIFSIALQPVFCFIILKEFRIEILRKLRDLGCCKCLPQRCWPPDDTLRVRLQELEENTAQE